MEKKWYYAENRRQAGPVSCEELKTLLAGGRLPADALVWHAGLKTWQPASSFPELQEGIHPVTPESPAENLAEVDRLLPVQSTPPGEPSRPGVQLSQTPAPVQTPWVAGREYACLWRRFGAMLLDDIILLIMIIPVTMLGAAACGFLQASLSSPNDSGEFFGYSVVGMLASFAGSFFASVLLQFVYSGFFLNRYGATPGKLALGIQVVRSDGSTVSFLRGGARALAEMLSSWFCFIGYLIAFFDEQRRTLHDHLCDTRVVQK